MNTKEIVKKLGINAKKAASKLSNTNSKIKNLALENLKKELDLNINEIIEVNKKDIENANLLKLSSAMIDRLTLTKDRIQGIIKSLDDIVNLNDPIGKVLSEWDRPNGLHIKKVSVPLGVIGLIYESRPNVTVDASAISIKAGNSVILRGGKDSFFSSKKLTEIINKAFVDSGLPENSVQMVPIPEREAVNEMLKIEPD